MVTPLASGPSDELVAWLCRTIARACHLEADAVSAESSVLELGLDSLTFVSVLTQLEAAHGIELSPDETLALLEAADVRALACALGAILARRTRDVPE